MEKMATLSAPLINLISKRGVVGYLQTRIVHTGCLSPVVMIMAFQSVSVPSDSHPLKDWSVRRALNRNDTAKV